MIVNRNIVLKREGNNLLLPTIHRKAVEVPSNAPSKAFVMCRIVSYDQNSGTLSLTLFHDLVGNGQYQIAIEENSELLYPLLINKVIFVERPSRPTIPKPFYKKQLDVSPKQNEYRKERKKQKETINLPVKDLIFLDGKVNFEYYISHVSRKVSFDVVNPFLKKEFDSIKNYFPKVLNLDKFAIDIEYEYLDGKILSNTCTSPQISSIDSSIFEQVEDLYIADHIINGSGDDIVNLSDIAIETSKKIGSENLQDVEWLLNKLINSNRTKHYYHLRYLSDKHSSKDFNLKLISKPLSFIFLLPISNGFCLIWETYSTDEATYIWRIDDKPLSEIKSSVEKIIDLIKWLRENNKMNYLKTKPENFFKIEHNYSGEDLGFKKWKSQLENLFE